MVLEELGFKVDIDALLFDGDDRHVLTAESYFFALAMKAMVTLSSWSNSPSTLPRAAGSLAQRPDSGWLRACVLDP